MTEDYIKFYKVDTNDQFLYLEGSSSIPYIIILLKIANTL